MIQVPGSEGYQQIDHAAIDVFQFQLVTGKCLTKLPVDSGLKPPVIDKNGAISAAIADQGLNER